MKHMLVFAMLFHVGDGFNFTAFLSCSNSAGVKLAADGPEDTVNGHASLSNNVLAVELYSFKRDPENNPRKKMDAPAGAAPTLIPAKMIRPILQACIDQPTEP